MTALLRAELARALSRRFVRVLVGAAVAVIAFAGVLAFFQTDKFDRAAVARARTQLAVDIEHCRTELSQQACDAEIHLSDYDRSLPLVRLWPADESGGVLSTTILFLVFGAIVAAASVVGADFRSGMLGTLLTWEPRRVRVAVARVTVAALAAAAIAIMVQLLVIGALLPAMLLHGGTVGADAEWFRGLVAGMAKGAVLVGFAAVLGASLALIGRSTAVAIAVAVFYLNILENVVREWKPGLGRWSIVNNAGVFLLGPQPELRASPSPAITLMVYALALGAVAVALFRRRDIASV